jgi:YVTN family beta-propeller protein
MKGKGRYQIWLTLGLFCVSIILPCWGYGADLSIGNAVTVNGDLIVTGSISEGGSGAKTPLQIALLRWYDANTTGNSFSVGNTPYGVAFDGASIWVARFNSNNVTKLRASDGTVLGTYPAGSNPEVVAFDGANIWVVNYGGNNVTKLRASDGTNLGTFPVGTHPQGIAFDGANIWVANSGSGTVTKLQASDGTNLGTFPVGNGPWGVAFDGANIWITNAGSNSVSKL